MCLAFSSTAGPAVCVQSRSGLCQSVLRARQTWEQTGEVTVSAFCSSPMLQDLFKGFARHLSHLLTQEQSPARKTGVSGVIAMPRCFMALEGQMS